MKQKHYLHFALLIVAAFAAWLLSACRAQEDNIHPKAVSTGSAQIIDTGHENTGSGGESYADKNAVPETEDTAENSMLTSDQAKTSSVAESADKEKNQLPKSDIPSSFTACSADLSNFFTMKYWLYTPSNPTDNMPLIVYLHGSSGKGDNLNLITAADGFPKYLQSGQLGDVRAYVLIPQLPGSEKGWAGAAEAVVDLINSTVSEYRLDRNNISLTGHSMGGTGTWNLAGIYPDTFARIAPLSGSVRNMQDVIGKLKSIPIWAFAGSADTIVPPDSSIKAVNALKDLGGDAAITVFDGADHFSVSGLAYLDKDIDLVGWLIGSR